MGINEGQIWDELNDLMSMPIPGDEPVSRQMWKLCVPWILMVDWGCVYVPLSSEALDGDENKSFEDLLSESVAEAWTDFISEPFPLFMHCKGSRGLTV